MDLQTLANLAQILGAVAVVAAIVFGFVQIRQFRVQRRDAAAAELARSFQDASFTQSFRLITALPDNATAEQLRARGRAMEEAALAIRIRDEAAASLFFLGIMPPYLVRQFTGQ